MTASKHERTKGPDHLVSSGCDCITKVNAKLAARGDNTRILVPWVGPQCVFIETIKADDKKRGNPSKLFANFCPFCGTKYPAEDSALSLAKTEG